MTVRSPTTLERYTGNLLNRNEALITNFHQKYNVSGNLITYKIMWFGVIANAVAINQRPRIRI